MICAVCDVLISSFPNPATGVPYVAAVKQHNAGKWHKKCSQLCLTRKELESWHAEQIKCRSAEKLAHEQALRDVNGRRQALAIGILATRVRAAHGNLENARRVWEIAASEKLQATVLSVLPVTEAVESASGLHLRAFTREGRDSGRTNCHNQSTLASAKTLEYTRSTLLQSLTTCSGVT